VVVAAAVEAAGALALVVAAAGVALALTVSRFVISVVII
jgi:hypothetical protein